MAKKKKAAKAVVRQASTAASDAARKAAMTKIVMENTPWRGEELETAVAIMLRESGGNPGAYNGNRKTGDDSYGLFQLNTLGNLWNIYRGMGITDRKQLLDPATNAKAAYALYQRNGNTFRPWLGYRKGLTVEPQRAEAKSLVGSAGTTPSVRGRAGKSVPLNVPREWLPPPPAGTPERTTASMIPTGTTIDPATGRAVTPQAPTALFGQNPSPLTRTTPTTFQPVEKIPRGGELRAGLSAVQAQVAKPAPVFQPVEKIPLGGEAATGARVAAKAKTTTTGTAGKSVPLPTTVTNYANGQIPANQLVAVEGGTLEANAASAYNRMRTAALAAGVNLGITDSYRSYDQQVDLVRRKGLYSQGGLGAKPGTSEHGWGQAIDVKGGPEVLVWLQQNASKYGFTANTPREPWHYGYVGPGSVKGGDKTWAQADAASLGVDLPDEYGLVPDTHGNGYTSGDPGEDEIRGALGWMSAYLDTPVVGDILRARASGDISENEMNAQLWDTDWWRNTQSSVREWDGNMQIDPATLEAQIQSRMTEIQTQATQLGFSIDPGHLHDMAVASLRMAMNDDQIAHAIGGEALRIGTLGTSTTAQNVRTTASDYGVPMSDGTIDSWTRNIATGTATTEDLRQQLVNQAKGLYPSFSDGIDRGLTVRDLADPYVELARQDLEVDPDTISFSDPKWSGAITGADPKTGQQNVLSLDQFRQKIRSDPTYGWQNTTNARGLAWNFAATLGKAFGTYAGTPGA